MKKNKLNFFISERLNIYKDFTMTLTHIILDYYIDRDSLNNDVDVANHYNWCYDKTCDIFLKEEIDFKDNEELRDYFFSYYYDRLYFTNEQDDKSHYIQFCVNIFFNIDNQEIMKVLKELYQTFNYSLEKKQLNHEKNLVVN